MFRSTHWKRTFRSVRPCCLLVGLIGSVPQLHGQGAGSEHEEFDAYRVRIETLWFDARPSGTFHGTTGNGFFDFQRDVHFYSYTSFTGAADWRVTRKNHILFGFIPFDRTKQFVVNQPITFQGQTYVVGLSASARLKTTHMLSLTSTTFSGADAGASEYVHKSISSM